MRSSDVWCEEEPTETEKDQERPRRRRPPLDDYAADIGERSGSLMWSLARAQGG